MPLWGLLGSGEGDTGGASEAQRGWDTRRVPTPVLRHRLQSLVPITGQRKTYTLKKHPSEAELMFAIYQGGGPRTPPCPPPHALCCVPLLAEAGSAWLDSETRAVSVKTQRISGCSPHRQTCQLKSCTSQSDQPLHTHTHQLCTQVQGLTVYRPSITVL